MSEQLKTTINVLNKFRLRANIDLFERIFEKDLGSYYWIRFTEKQCDLIAFYAYLDDAYKEVLLKFLASWLADSEPLFDLPKSAVEEKKE